MSTQYNKGAQDPNNGDEKPKRVEGPVIKGEVITIKKPFGRKLKDVFVKADFKSVGIYLVMDVLLPAAKGMAVDAVTEGANRVFYGDGRRGPRPGPGFGTRVTYNKMSSPMGGAPMGYPSAQFRARANPSIHHEGADNEYILPTRAEAEAVVDAMVNVLDQFQVVSLADLKEMLNVSPIPHTDHKLGWDSLVGTKVKQVREGYLIDLPQIQPLPWS